MALRRLRDAAFLTAFFARARRLFEAAGCLGRFDRADADRAIASSCFAGTSRRACTGILPAAREEASMPGALSGQAKGAWRGGGAGLPWTRRGRNATRNARWRGIHTAHLCAFVHRLSMARAVSVRSLCRFQSGCSASMTCDGITIVVPANSMRRQGTSPDWNGCPGAPAHRCGTPPAPASSSAGHVAPPVGPRLRRRWR